MIMMCARTGGKTLISRQQGDMVTNYSKEAATQTENKIFHYESSANIWSSLPEEVLEAKSINAFKNGLDKFWKDQYAPI